MKVRFSQALSMVKKTLLAKLVPMLHGSPGVGKSALGYLIAKEYNLLLIDVRLAQTDPTELNGFPFIFEARGRAGYVPMDTFPLEGDDLPVDPKTGHRYDGWLLFLDEMTSAALMTQSAAYKIVLDRKVGQRPMHHRVAIIAAGNLITDNAVVNEMSTAMQSRLIHIEMESALPDFLRWAEDNKINPLITSFLQFKPDALFSFKPDHNDFTYACNRTWEFAHKIMEVTPNLPNGEPDPDRLPLLQGALSDGVGTEFYNFAKRENELPKMYDIINTPETAMVPQESSVQFILTGALASHANDKNLDALIKYIFRLPGDTQACAIRNILRKERKFMQNPVLIDWVANSGEILF